MLRLYCFDKIYGKFIKPLDKAEMICYNKCTSL